MKKIIRQRVSCGFGKFEISVIDFVDEYTEYNDDKTPKDGFGTAIEVRLMSPAIGDAKITTNELHTGDFRKIADMFTLLAVEEDKLVNAKG